MGKKRILIADDHPLMLDMVKEVIESRHDVVGTCGDGATLVNLASSLLPDIVIADVDMPKMDGLAAAARILAEMPEVKVIFFTAHTNPVYVRQALKTKASGYVLKSRSALDLLQAVDSVIDGHQYLSDEIAQCGEPNEGAPSLAQRPDLRSLTVRQLQILQLIGMGAGSKQVAAQLEISTKTVDFHRAQMLARFGVHSITELVLLAAEQGLIRHPANSTHVD